MYNKRKLLFIMDTFPLGGISKSLLALLNELDSNKYEIDMLLMRQEGLFVPMIPRHVTLLPEPLPVEFRNPHPKNLLRNLSSLSFPEWLKWMRFSIKCSVARITGGLHRHIQVMDKWLGKNTPSITKHYDAAIAYQGGRCIYYLIERIDATVKIGYVHTDYRMSEVDYMLRPVDKHYFPQLNAIVTISPKCRQSLIEEFPDIAHKVKVIENICSPKLICSMANDQIYDFDDDGYVGVKIVTMGRFDIQTKGLDLAIAAAKILKDDGIKFKWYFVGDGKQRQEVEKLISDNALQKDVILLGAKANPYPYIQRCDIYVQPSRFEGKSVALDEVKALHKPVVVTNFSTVYDQFIDGKTAIICEMNPVDIAGKIKRLIMDKNLRDTLISNLQQEKVGNEEQAQVFESLIS